MCLHVEVIINVTKNRLANSKSLGEDLHAQHCSAKGGELLSPFAPHLKGVIMCIAYRLFLSVREEAAEFMGGAGATHS